MAETHIFGYRIFDIQRDPWRYTIKCSRFDNCHWDHPDEGIPALNNLRNLCREKTEETGINYAFEMGIYKDHFVFKIQYTGRVKEEITGPLWDMAKNLAFLGGLGD